MLNNIILGLLLFRSLSIYEIKKAIDSTVSFFYSSSYGNIVPALKKLENGNQVTVTQNIVNGRNRKEYSITPKGRESFKTWLAQEINIGKIQDEALLRFFFITELSPEVRIKLLQDYTVKLQNLIIELTMIKEGTMKMEVTEEHQEAFRYRLVTLDFGIQYYQFELNWYNSIIEKVIRKEL
jgi:PadR family transcriptional regulator, regulatory protein AphA